MGAASRETERAEQLDRDTGIAVSQLKSGADERIRTADLLITNQLLYQLSYVG